MKYIITTPILLIFLFALGCSNREDCLREVLLKFSSRPVVIQDSAMPFETNDSSTYRLVFYIDSVGCTGCTISSLAEKEQQARQDSILKKIRFVYIFDIDSTEQQNVQNLLFRYRIEGDIHIDTHKSFIQDNPHFPDNPLFHTFLINNSDSVILVGDPFANERIMGLLNSVIDNQIE